MKKFDGLILKLTNLIKDSEDVFYLASPEIKEYIKNLITAMSDEVIDKRIIGCYCDKYKCANCGYNKALREIKSIADKYKENI